MIRKTIQHAVGWLLEATDDMLGLVYPRLCAACGKEQVPRTSCLCISCRLQLPFTDYHLVPENGMTLRLKGRFPIVAATALLYFVKDSPVQDLLHRIKYQGQQQAAVDLGKLYGSMLKEQALWQHIDFIIPVPLHPSRMHHRGFNQSAAFARGLGETMSCKVLENGLKRTRATATQTHMNRRERLDNTSNAFVVTKPEILIGKHLLLVDDVMTTGATLEACAIPLLALEGVHISLATIAIAQE
ncbi:MAG: ComF family protein [Saprospiraceae bacterium]|jgi:ComF family protein|nr:ComF family protein [Saprospiraceae bacterium]